MKSLRDQILAHVKPGGPSGDCWVWQMSRDRDGYGHVWHDGKARRAHRVSYEAFVGPVGDFHVLHRCDNPACTAPEHLCLGTHADNMSEMAAKGRQSRLRGEANGRSKLTEADVIDVHRRLKLGHTQHTIAADLGVSKTMVSYIKTGRRWGHVRESE